MLSSQGPAYIGLETSLRIIGLRYVAIFHTPLSQVAVIFADESKNRNFEIFLDEQIIEKQTSMSYVT